MQMVWVIKRQRCGQDGRSGTPRWYLGDGLVVVWRWFGGGLVVVGRSTLQHARGLREGGEGKPSEQGDQE